MPEPNKAAVINLESGNEPVAPHVFGPLAPEYAHELAKAQPRSPYTKEMLKAIGAKAAAGNYALVVENHGTNMEVGSHYIALNPNGLGDRVRPDKETGTFDHHRLPSVQTSYEALTRERDAAMPAPVGMDDKIPSDIHAEVTRQIGLTRADQANRAAAGLSPRVPTMPN